MRFARRTCRHLSHAGKGREATTPSRVPPAAKILSSVKRRRALMAHRPTQRSLGSAHASSQWSLLHVMLLPPKSPPGRRRLPRSVSRRLQGERLALNVERRPAAAAAWTTPAWAATRPAAAALLVATHQAAVRAAASVSASVASERGLRRHCTLRARPVASSASTRSLVTRCQTTTRQWMRRWRTTRSCRTGSGCGRPG